MLYLKSQVFLVWATVWCTSSAADVSFPPRPVIGVNSSHSRRLLTLTGEFFVEEKFPHQIARIPPSENKVIPGSGILVATVSAMYEVNSYNWLLTSAKMTSKLAKWLYNIDPDYLVIEQTVTVIGGKSCSRRSMLCRDSERKNWLHTPGLGGADVDGDLSNVDLRTCKPADGSSTAGAGFASNVPTVNFDPEWRSDDGLRDLAWSTIFCVSKHNTSILLFPQVLNNTYFTAFRSDESGNNTGNLKVGENKDLGIDMYLHIVGAIPVTWAKFLNYKFILKDKIPLPLYQPEVVDQFANYTDNLNLSLLVYGINQEVLGIRGAPIKYLPVCVDPKVAARGCFRIDHQIYDHPSLNQYAFRDKILYKRTSLTKALSDDNYPAGEFNLTEGPWPRYEWYGPIMAPEAQDGRYSGPWSQYEFPRTGYSVSDLVICKALTNCSEIPLVPTPRYLHSAVLYYTWDFETHARKYLCDQNPTCGTDCLTNLTCLGGANAYFAKNFYFASSEFADDDGGSIPPRLLSDVDCPRTCCHDRRICLRRTDTNGYEIPFNSPMMLIFGGKSYEHIKDPATGRLVYHNCEHINPDNMLEEWRACTEVTLDEMWRYDVMRNKWEFIKTDSATSLTTLKPVGWPVPRFGHGAVIIELINPQDTGSKQVFMYLFGGMSSECNRGVCNDVWRYEIPWAAQAYYPKFSSGGEWVRANIWDRLKDNPFGGRYRHSMVATSSNQYIYVYGGQIVGGFQNTLLRYRVSTDFWEDMDPSGSYSLVRLMYNYRGESVEMNVDVSQYDEATDVTCAEAYQFTGKYQHCKVCPRCGIVFAHREAGGLMPTARGDLGMINYKDIRDDAADDSILVFGGFRTTWGTLDAGTAELCPVTSSTTTTTYSPALVNPVGVPSFTAPPVLTTTQRNYGGVRTTTLQGGIQIVGSFETLGGDLIVTTTIAPYNTRSATTTVTNDPSVGLFQSGNQVTQTRTSSTYTETSTETMTTTSSTITTRLTLTSTLTSTATKWTGRTTTITTQKPKLTTAPPVEIGAPPSQGAASKSSSVSKESSTRVGPRATCTPKYYFDDTWFYDTTYNRWSLVQTPGTQPGARKGHSLIARNTRGNDTVLVLFGGNLQDTSLSDIWILYVKRSGSSKTWTRVDNFFPGASPPNMSYHTMLYVPELDTAYVFGGLSWASTDIAVSDSRRNDDRRCFKDAQGLIENEQGKTEADFLSSMMMKCNLTKFCCLLTESIRKQNDIPPEYLAGVRIRTDTYALNLTAVSLLCRSDCQNKSFYPEFHPILSEGVWSFNMTSCPSNCNGHGTCDFSQCICELGWYGTDCGLQQCPGQVCYADETSKEQRCLECSQHGQCVNGQCLCDPGWTNEDCSAVMCEGNCSSTPDDVHGICVEDFPVNQCVCFGKWSTYNCSQLLCLNECSGHGTCVGGECQCSKGYHGDDCSIFMISFERAGNEPST